MTRWRDDEERTWEDVERLFNDLKNDGYGPVLISTSTTTDTDGNNPIKAIQVNLERTLHTDTDHSKEADRDD